jgi:hypothetical protein
MPKLPIFDEQARLKPFWGHFIETLRDSGKVTTADRDLALGQYKAVFKSSVRQWWRNYLEFESEADMTLFLLKFS